MKIGQYMALAAMAAVFSKSSMYGVSCFNTIHSGDWYKKHLTNKARVKRMKHKKGK
jgi:hypothetical protein